MKHYSATSVRSFGGQRPVTGKRVLIDPSAVVSGDVQLANDDSFPSTGPIRCGCRSVRIRGWLI